MAEVPSGLEDVSKYPDLVRSLFGPFLIPNGNRLSPPQIAEMYRRGWTKYDLQRLAGGNLLRVLRGAEKVAMDLQSAGAQPVVDLYDKRSDLPARYGLSSDEL